jgi:hypothetical protein
LTPSGCSAFDRLMLSEFSCVSRPPEVLRAGTARAPLNPDRDRSPVAALPIAFARVVLYRTFGLQS